MKLSRRILDWLIVTYLIAVFYFSTAVFSASLKLNRIRVLTLRCDYLLHALMFIPWMILAGWRWSGGSNRRAAFWLPLAAGILTTGFLEGLQLAIPYRATSNNDLLANLVGLAIGAGISLGWGREKKVVSSQ